MKSLSLSLQAQQDELTKNKLVNNLDALNYANKVLKLNNIESYKIDSELLLSKVLNSSREKILINLDYKIEKENLSNLEN